MIFYLIDMNIFTSHTLFIISYHIYEMILVSHADNEIPIVITHISSKIITQTYISALPSY